MLSESHRIINLVFYNNLLFLQLIPAFNSTTLIVHKNVIYDSSQLVVSKNEFNILTLFTQQQQRGSIFLETFLEVLAKYNFQS